MEIPEVASKRFFVTTGYFKEICDIIRKNLPQYKDFPRRIDTRRRFPRGWDVQGQQQEIGGSAGIEVPIARGMRR
jgi:hypothetical protein